VENNRQRVRPFTVSGIFKTGLEDYDKKFAIVDIRQIQKLNGWSENEVGGFEVFLDNIDDLDLYWKYIYEEELDTDLFAQTIREMYPSLFGWLDLQDVNVQFILLLMVIVAIINMTTALMILIFERTNMIGILKALGNTNWNIRRIFLYYAAYIIGIGLILGNFIGLSFCFLQDAFDLIQLDESAYYVSVAPVQINWWTVLFLNIGTLIITLLAMVIPSYLVTQISPVKAVRYK
ncbi:MAG: ABC transporter permease, partial [Saprospiraceae bacterium]